MLIAVENSKDAVPLWEARFDGSGVFMLGNEADGLNSEIAEMADLSICFPQTGIRKCINVSSTAAVIASEIQRRKLMKSSGILI